jgi:type IV pilus assembly protein PilC
MPLFKYTAKNEHGDTLKGKVEARSANQAAMALRSRNLLVITVQPISGKNDLPFKDLFEGVKFDDVVTFTRQLSTMITAGLPLTQGLSILAQQSKPGVAKMVSDLQREIEGGTSFAKALEKQPKIFSRVYTQLVRAGETGGVLDTVLQRLADNMERDKEFKAKTKGALIYPIIVVIAMIVVALVMMIFVVPQLTEMYKDFDAELPMATQILISTSSLMATFWYVGVGAAVGAWILFQRWVSTHTGRRAFDRFMIKLPVFGVLRQKTILTEFTRTLSLLLGSGISLLQAIDIVAEGINNTIYRDALQQSITQVEKGVPFSQSISKFEMFPPILSQMVAVGEETGKLDDVLLKLSVYFQSESEHAIKNLTTALEPMIMIVLGIGVGLMVVAIIMPIYNLTSQF